jgi:hypothetical protein
MAFNVVSSADCRHAAAAESNIDDNINDAADLKKAFGATFWQECQR